MVMRSLKKIIPTLIFFSGLSFVFFVGIGKFPKRLGADFNEWSKTVQRRLSSVSPATRPLVDQHKLQEPIKDKPDSPSDSTTDEVLGEASGMPEKFNEKLAKEPVPSEPLEVLQEAPPAMAVPKKGSVCESVELREDDLAKKEVPRLSGLAWNPVVAQFHQAKDLLLKWLKANGSSLSSATVEVMENQIHSLKIVQPSPAMSLEPDLAWRGIGVVVRKSQSSSLLLISPGLIKLFKSNPQRAGFEMLRLVAQSWAPCELLRLKVEPVWGPLLKCLGEAEPNNCADPRTLESTWAVSSSLAVLLGSSGCELPVFKDEKKKSCIHQLLGASERGGAHQSRHHSEGGQ